MKSSIVLIVLWASTVAGGAAFQLISVSDEVEIGKKANTEVHNKTPELKDGQVVGYVRAIGRRLIPHAGGPEYPYSFDVADYREINAFALPGGPVWIHRGVLQSAGNESQVAGVLAHEIAHISRRHAANQLTKATIANLGLGLLGAMLGNDGGAAASRAAAGFLTNGVFLKFSRDDERDADSVGLEMMARAGWDPRGMIELFEVLRREQRRDPSGVEVFFSTHPAPQDRAARLQADVARLPARGVRDSAEFRAVKARLARMPAPKPMPRQ